MADFLKDYEPVEDRLRAFWSEHPYGRVETEMVSAEDGDYIFRASVWRERAAEVGLTPGVTGPDSTGYAHDSTTSLPNNMKASALEVCETSAIGRALANLGYAAKGKRPSREEMSKDSSNVEPVARPSTERSSEGGGMAEGDGSGAPVPDPVSGESAAYGEGAAGSSDRPGDQTPPAEGAGEDSQPARTGAPSLVEQRKDFRAYLSQRYSTADALMMARALFQTQTRKVPNMTVLDLDELQAVDVELKARKLEAS